MTRITRSARRRTAVVMWRWGAGYRVLRLPASLVERRLREAVALVREALSR